MSVFAYCQHKRLANALCDHTCDAIKIRPRPNSIVFVAGELITGQCCDHTGLFPESQALRNEVEKSWFSEEPLSDMMVGRGVV